MTNLWIYDGQSKDFGATPPISQPPSNPPGILNQKSNKKIPTFHLSTSE
jgi:hypothetical protein